MVGNPFKYMITSTAFNKMPMTKNFIYGKGCVANWDRKMSNRNEKGVRNKHHTMNALKICYSLQLFHHTHSGTVLVSLDDAVPCTELFWIWFWFFDLGVTVVKLCFALIIVDRFYSTFWRIQSFASFSPIFWPVAEKQSF